MKAVTQIIPISLYHKKDPTDAPMGFVLPINYFLQLSEELNVLYDDFVKNDESKTHHFKTKFPQINGLLDYMEEYF